MTGEKALGFITSPACLIKLQEKLKSCFLDGVVNGDLLDLLEGDKESICWEEVGEEKNKKSEKENGQEEHLPES